MSEDAEGCVAADYAYVMDRVTEARRGAAL